MTLLLYVVVLPLLAGFAIAVLAAWAGGEKKQPGSAPGTAGPHRHPEQEGWPMTIDNGKDRSRGDARRNGSRGW